MKRQWICGAPQETGAYWLRSKSCGDMLVTVTIAGDRRLVLFGADVITKFDPSDRWLKIPTPEEDPT